MGDPMGRSLADTRFLQAVGFRIREARVAIPLTQAELADRCGLHRTFIGSVERGERNLSLLNLRLLAVHLRVPIGVLLKDGKSG